MGGYALGGRFTTLEGLLINIKEQVETNPLFGATAAIGDSAVDTQKAKIEKFKNDLDALAECKTPFKLILDDPAGNSYIQVIQIDVEHDSLSWNLDQRATILKKYAAICFSLLNFSHSKL